MGVIADMPDEMSGVWAAAAELREERGGAPREEEESQGVRGAGRARMRFDELGAWWV